MKDRLKEILLDYICFIEAFKNEIIAQDIKEESLYGTGGNIGDYKFQYHGAGCRLEKLGVICEYDFLPENGYPIKFSTWDISEFIRSNQIWSELHCSLEILHEHLLSLVEEKELFLLELEGLIFPVFQVKDIKDWIL